MTGEGGRLGMGVDTVSTEGVRWVTALEDETLFHLGAVTAIQRSTG